MYPNSPAGLGTHVSPCNSLTCYISLLLKEFETHQQSYEGTYTRRVHIHKGGILPEEKYIQRAYTRRGHTRVDTHTEGKCTQRRDIPTDERTHGGTYMAGTYIQRRIHMKGHILTWRNIHTEGRPYGGTYTQKNIRTEETYTRRRDTHGGYTRRRHTLYRLCRCSEPLTLRPNY